MTEPKFWRVWWAGGDYESDGVTVCAPSAAAAAQSGAAELFEPHDPVNSFDVFVQAGASTIFRDAYAEELRSERFTILVDVNRVSFDQKAKTMEVKSANFTPCRFEEHAAPMQASQTAPEFV
jgi:hypothetical protein